MVDAKTLCIDLAFGFAHRVASALPRSGSAQRPADSARFAAAHACAAHSPTRRGQCVAHSSRRSERVCGPRALGRRCSGTRVSSALGELGLERVEARDHGGHRLFDVLGDDVDLQVDRRAHLLVGDDNLLLRVRDQHEVEPALSVIDVANRERRAIDRDEALGDNIRQQPRRRLDLDVKRIAVRPQLLDRSDVVDVPLDKVARVTAVGGERALEVDGVAWLERFQVGPPDRLRRQPDREARAVELGDGEADAVHRDAAAERGLLEDDVRLDVHFPSLTDRPVPQFHPADLLQPLNGAHLLDDAREHGARSGSAADAGSHTRRAENAAAAPPRGDADEQCERRASHSSVLGRRDGEAGGSARRLHTCTPLCCGAAAEV
mmetsp:Transcript_20139/g.59824  ORF Transcript_20139/g.59824 Transcript_20139/m.59824 type:complete len:377 (+) Transcript_20139:116-1246(+)